ncbi:MULTISPECIES: CBS domain-containing protein [Sinorhizobium]|uniref:CBS domain-containing protein n=1 Tax=Sinorhizobium americanum TaxID=194963 RepID=A0A1L3LN65_9HYPH|nr:MULTISPECIES: CBS domain-containing protein [Sinorhizobium]APG84882.1 inosine-5'-monophosphate dehydrogenase [Sinorhizobium americanum CCGM7]APG91524.1 inosine-5'-monophosphate dehydrogenase [Sinorhizobium americanum]ASY56961.1 Inosine-5'-monophosphate dehydrogenase [Sinorhizobium sp. CCBAU 05631]OAP37428.1 inosine-5-monophosphate dehydrogenase [Sinorhizobium americanum]PDT54716.1 CBS domain-containing protein [Sinorhizobium sp. NG07B]
MRTEEAMHSGVRWIGPEADLRTIARIMKEEDIGALPVGENDRLIGMVTDRDLTLRALANGRDVSSLTARDVMTREIVYCRTNESVEDAIHLMESKKIRRLPVINDDKRMVGMLSLGDISHCTSQQLAGELVKAVSAHHA